MLSERSHNLPTTATADWSCPAGATFSGRSPRKSLATFRRKNEAGEERNQRGWSRGLEPERSV